MFGRRAVITYAIAGAILLLAHYIHQGYGGSFDPAVWKRATQSDANVRKRMVRDIISKKILLGASRDEVIRLLGPPDRVGRYVEEGNDVELLKLSGFYAARRYGSSLARRARCFRPPRSRRI